MLTQFVLADHAGNALGELTTASARKITAVRNQPREAVCTISHDDPQYEQLLTEMQAGVPRIKVYRDGGLWLHGYLAPFQETAEDTSQVQLRFRDAFGRLLGDGPGRGRHLAASVTYTALDAAQIAKDLVEDNNANEYPSGIVTSTTTGKDGIDVVAVFEPTVTRDRTYQAGQNIGEAIVNLTEVLDGFDFEVLPVDPAAADWPDVTGVLAVYASQGQDQPDVVFEYGPDTLRNVTRFARSTQHPVNRVVALGAAGLATESQDATSIITYGGWPLLVSYPDVVESATLQGHGDALLRPGWTQTITFNPEPDLAPVPFVDYGIGDTVRMNARRGGLLVQSSPRINQIAVTIDDNGRDVLHELQVEQEVAMAGMQLTPSTNTVIGALRNRLAAVERASTAGL